VKVSARVVVATTPGVSSPLAESIEVSSDLLRDE